MKTAITTDLKNASFEAKREFKADISLVWKAWTEASFLDQWWAPAPWKCETRQMDFKEGGKWIYDMVGPGGEKHGGIQLYEKIVEEDFFSGKDAFADEQGNIKNDLPVCSWKNTFIKTETGTLVSSVAYYSRPEDLETVLNMGMAEGLTVAHNQLEEILREQIS